MNQKYLRAGVGISLGLCFGAAFAMALHNLGVVTDLNVAASAMCGAALGGVLGLS